MATTSIEWTDATWNPVVGCTKVSDGCRNCYAMTMAARLANMAAADQARQVNPGRKLNYIDVVKSEWRGGDNFPTWLPIWNNRVVCVPEALADPLGWKKPRRVFVNSMSDLFHEAVAFEFIAAVFGVMDACGVTEWGKRNAGGHTFQVLTKRPERAAQFYAWLDQQSAEVSPLGPRWTRQATYCNRVACNVNEVFAGHAASTLASGKWPPPNVWLGTSVENQETFEARAFHLGRCRAAVRFFSYEPALGPVDWGTLRKCPACGAFATVDDFDCLGADPDSLFCNQCHHEHEPVVGGPDWIISGGESGRNPRVSHPDLHRAARDFCAQYGIPYFFKQWGEWLPYEPNAQPPLWNGQNGGTVDGHSFPESLTEHEPIDGWWCPSFVPSNKPVVYRRVGKKTAGRLLDGVEHNAFPKAEA